MDGGSELWQRFHEAVNMTSRELTDWLGTSKELQRDPTGSAPALGTAVLGILRKRFTDLTEDDRQTMWRVITVVEEETAGRSTGDILADERRRYRLLNVGHDPVKAG